MNGGMLAKRIQKVGAELIGFGISDAVGNPATKDIGIPYENTQAHLWDRIKPHWRMPAESSRIMM